MKEPLHQHRRKNLRTLTVHDCFEIFPGDKPCSSGHLANLNMYQERKDGSHKLRFPHYTCRYHTDCTPVLGTCYIFLPCTRHTQYNLVNVAAHDHTKDIPHCLELWNIFQHHIANMMSVPIPARVFPPSTFRMSQLLRSSTIPGRMQHRFQRHYIAQVHTSSTRNGRDWQTFPRHTLCKNQG